MSPGPLAHDGDGRLVESDRDGRHGRGRDRGSTYGNWRAQTAPAARAQQLLDLAGRCHPRTPRRHRWANAMIKVASPQVLTS
ncbi:hypothetical protein [Streptomyces sp. NPDC001665]